MRAELGLVSIHARHLWRANRGGNKQKPSRTRFQSTPAISGGRTMGDCIECPDCGVSIHARHLWRANRLQRALPPDPPPVSIHARHLWRANRTIIVRCTEFVKVSIHARHLWRANPEYRYQGSVVMVFQSTPAISGGRTGRGKTACWRRCRFNPRPPSLAGEPCLKSAAPSKPRSFNPRPPSLAGEPRATGACKD